MQPFLKLLHIPLWLWYTKLTTVDLSAIAAPANVMLRIYLFGNLHIFTGDTPLPRPASNKIFVLLAYLLLKGRCSVFCEYLPTGFGPMQAKLKRAPICVNLDAPFLMWAHFKRVEPVYLVPTQSVGTRYTPPFELNASEQTSDTPSASFCVVLDY